MQQLVNVSDCIVEVQDARMPLSGRNPSFNLLRSLPRVIVLNKADLAPANTLKRVRSMMEDIEPGVPVLACSSEAKSRRGIDKVLPAVLSQMDTTVFDRQVARLSILVAGIPNVGKSTFINALRNVSAGKGKCHRTGPQPGVTRVVQTRTLVHVDPPVYVIDTPGIMPSQVEHVDTAMRMALCGNLRDDVVGEDYIADYLLYTLNRRKLWSYLERYALPAPNDHIQEVLEHIAQHHGFLMPGGIPDVDRAARTFLDDFRKGRLGRIMLDPILLGEKEELHAATMHFSQRAPPI